MSYDERMKIEAGKLRDKEQVRILAIESSCDETTAAVIGNGRKILSNIVFSQIPMHIPYGGVVPEIASRSHIEKLDAVTVRALVEAGLALGDMDAIAATQGPGLVGALLTGLSYAKGLAYGLGKPLLAVNHIYGHICANYLAYPDLNPPFLCLVASGGHSHLIQVREEGFDLLGCTQDDAAGEAFDKAARVLGLPYPGGPRLDDLAEKGNPTAFTLPLPNPAGIYDFSFSGLKTAFINLVHHLDQKGETPNPKDLAASFRLRVVEHLCERTLKACRNLGWDTLALAGGVSANRLLRRELAKRCEEAGIRLVMPPLSLCGDNAAMIGAAAYAQLMRLDVAGLDVNASPALKLFPEERLKR
ncbi:MAG: tRNA (adenosine(37)-N6)-threonylcarbamoyltransferase complex transferase subunit TsaD [Eubacteriales bacterium]|nr:tRNA (adenosine(37)-N6)-threonylcarbamoyltransferase complex transferase subunit TsaD [Eubacteriales bacterium]